VRRFLHLRPLTATKVERALHNESAATMDKPPKLWRLLVMLAAVIAVIIYLKYYLPAELAK
jgi:hypothetical protein